MSEVPRRKIRSGLITLGALMALGGLTAILVTLGMIGRGGTHKDWFVHVAPDTLVEYSQHIVVARCVEETVHEIPNSASDPPTVKSFTDVFRRFEVVESLKGGFAPGETVYVAWDAGYTITSPETGAPIFNPRPVAPLAKDENYALFLKRRISRSSHPDDVATRVWQTPLGLEVALVDDRGRLSFQTDQYYRNALDDLGFKPVPGSGAPFELTTDDVRELVASDYVSPN